MSDSFAIQLRLAEEKLLASLSRGPDALEDFGQIWSTLQQSLSLGLEQESIDEETLLLADITFTRVETILTHFLQLYRETDDLAASLQVELSDMFCHLSINEYSSLPSSKPDASENPTCPSGPTPQPIIPLPPYIPPAYIWLLDNLHDPYPSKEVKNKIAAGSKCSFKDVDGWFTSIRKRIGWNKLRSKAFSNKRSLIVKAATRAFKPSSLQCEVDRDKPIDNSAREYALDFIMIETTAKELYADKFHETSLASSIDALIKDPPSVPEIKNRSHKGASSYPSPEHSPNRVQSPPLPLTVSSSSKRKRSDDASSDPHSSHQKRSRISSPRISQDIAAASLPSPAASVRDISHEVTLIPASSPAPSQVCGKRKRSQSSDTEDCRSTSPTPAKRQHVTVFMPYDETCPPQTSLDLTASELALEQWLNGTIDASVVSDDVPSPVAIKSDETVPVEVDLFSYDFSQYSPLTPLSLESSPSSPEPLSPPATIELPNNEGENNTLQPLAESLLCSEGSSTSTSGFLPSWLAVQQVNHSISPSLLFSGIEVNCPSFVDLTSRLPVSQLAFGNLFSKSRDSSSVPINNVFAPSDTNSNSFRIPFVEDQYAKFSRLQFLRSEVNFLEASLGAF